MRQLLTESLLLAVTGTGLGILLAYRLLALIVAWMPERLFPPDVAIRINAPVLLFSAGLALATTVLFGLVPALQDGEAGDQPGDAVELQQSRGQRARQTAARRRWWQRRLR